MCKIKKYVRVIDIYFYMCRSINNTCVFLYLSYKKIKHYFVINKMIYLRRGHSERCRLFRNK